MISSNRRAPGWRKKIACALPLGRSTAQTGVGTRPHGWDARATSGLHAEAFGALIPGLDADHGDSAVDPGRRSGRWALPALCPGVFVVAGGGRALRNADGLRAGLGVAVVAFDLADQGDQLVDLLPHVVQGLGVSERLFDALGRLAQRGEAVAG